MRSVPPPCVSCPRPAFPGRERHSPRFCSTRMGVVQCRPATRTSPARASGSAPHLRFLAHDGRIGPSCGCFPRRSDPATTRTPRCTYSVLPAGVLGKTAGPSVGAAPPLARAATRPRRLRLSPCYTPVRAAPPSSRGPGHDPFKVEIRGSNPLGGTPAVFRRTALLAASTRSSPRSGRSRRPVRRRSDTAPPDAPVTPRQWLRAVPGDGPGRHRMLDPIDIGQLGQGGARGITRGIPRGIPLGHVARVADVAPGVLLLQLLQAVL